jgi:hypothetical protein
MNNILVVIISIILSIIIDAYNLYNKKVIEKFTTIESMTENDILPEYKDILPLDFIKQYGDSNTVAKLFLENNIPMSYMSDPSMYPKIASYIHIKKQENNS